jgi:hypothetical protein
MLLREWAAKLYPGAQLLEQYRLGPTRAFLPGIQLTPGLERALRVSNWFADGLLALPDKTLIIEAKVRPTPGAVGQILFYQRLAMQTPLLQQRIAIPIVPVLLWAERDDDVANFARQFGCRVEVYVPLWIVDYLQLVQLRNRSTAPPTSSNGDSQANGA